MVNKHFNKTDLVVAVQELLQTKTVGTQEELSLALQKKGIKVNQVKVSRLLNKLGAIKIKEGERIVYRLPTEMVSITPNDSLKQLILKIVHNENTIVIQTAPGCAQMVGRLLDQQKEIHILGTVAGDDTIFVVTEKSKQIESCYKAICKLLLG